MGGSDIAEWWEGGGLFGQQQKRQEDLATEAISTATKAARKNEPAAPERFPGGPQMSTLLGLDTTDRARPTARGVGRRKPLVTGKTGITTGLTAEELAAQKEEERKTNLKRGAGRVSTLLGVSRRRTGPGRGTAF